MNWTRVASIIRRAQCFERQRLQSCTCRTGDYNPCQVNEDVASVCDTVAAGKMSPDLDLVEDWLVKHTCQKSRADRGCKHRGCIEREEAIDFVRDARRRKVA